MRFGNSPGARYIIVQKAPGLINTSVWLIVDQKSAIVRGEMTSHDLAIVCRDALNVHDAEQD